MSGKNRTLVRIGKSADSGSAVVCIPQAGAGAGSFTELARSLRGKASVWSARFPGRESRVSERPLTTISAMVDSLIEPMAAIEAANIVLFGQCSGAFIAYELAHRLRSLNVSWPNQWLVVFGQEAPRARDPEAPDVRQDQLDLRAELSALGGTPDLILADDVLFELLAPVLRADIAATKNYGLPRERAKLTIPIVAAGGSSDTLIASKDIFLEWENLTTGAFECEFLEGGHFLNDENMASIGELLASLLARGEPRQV
jgi:surfactin synthase thioesterase subunit